MLLFYNLYYNKYLLWKIRDENWGLSSKVMTHLLQIGLQVILINRQFITQLLTSTFKALLSRQSSAGWQKETCKEAPWYHCWAWDWNSGLYLDETSVRNAKGLKHQITCWNSSRKLGEGLIERLFLPFVSTSSLKEEGQRPNQLGIDVFALLSAAKIQWRLGWHLLSLPHGLVTGWGLLMSVGSGMGN